VDGFYPELADGIDVEPGLGSARVIVAAARTWAPGESPVVASTPDGTSSATTGAGRERQPAEAGLPGLVERDRAQVVGGEVAVAHRHRLTTVRTHRRQR